MSAAKVQRPSRAELGGAIQDSYRLLQAFPAPLLAAHAGQHQQQTVAIGQRRGSSRFGKCGRPVGLALLRADPGRATMRAAPPIRPLEVGIRLRAEKSAPSSGPSMPQKNASSRRSSEFLILAIRLKPSQIVLGPVMRNGKPGQAKQRRRRNAGCEQDGTTPGPTARLPPKDRGSPGLNRLADEKSTQILGQRFGRRVAIRRLLFQAFQADRFQVGDMWPRNRRGGVGSWLRTWSSVANRVVPWKGGRPVSSSYRIAPSE